VSPTHQPRVLVLNAGSSSLKYRVVEPATGRAPLHGLVERIGTPSATVTHEGPEGEHSERRRVDDAEAAVAAVLESLAGSGLREADLAGIGHRVVHGGSDFTEPVRIDDDVVSRIEALSRLAPLHNPPAVAGIRAARHAFPDLAQVAVFDTAFFAGLPEAAATYAIEKSLAQRLGIRRYGMHGTSHAYVTGEVARHLGRDVGELAQIVLHLGNGASAAAVRGGRPLDTSMGLTPLEGLVMGTRAGDLDPGVLLHLLRHGDLDLDGLEDLLHHRSGLEGLAGRHDFRELLDAVDRGDADARTAYDVYCHRVRKYVGAYLAVLDGADVVVFTAGVGENVARVRADTMAGLDRLGIEIDPDRNDAPLDGTRRISADASRVTVLVVPTNEELQIAREALPLL
jgi:acetate kinase